MTNSFNHQSPARLSFEMVSHHLTVQATGHNEVTRGKHAADAIVVRVRPRTLRGITDLLSPLAYACFGAQTDPLRSEHPHSEAIYRAGTRPRRSTPDFAFARQWSRWATIERQRSRSLSQSSRQITPRTRNGHAPPSKGSRKSFQSVNHHCVRPW